MGKIILITGGARSGKSNFAEELLQDCGSALYVATNSAAQDSEMQKRIELHQQRRPKNWQTYEGFLEIAKVFAQKNYPTYLLDCATMLTTNYLYWLLQQQYGTDFAAIDVAINNFSEDEKIAIEQELIKEWQEIMVQAQNVKGDVVIVTNEVGLGIVPENPLSRWFRDIYGRVNQFLGREADDVYLVVAGIPMKIK